MKCTESAVELNGWERLYWAENCPKVDAGTCQPVSVNPSTPSGTTPATDTPASGTTSGAVTPTGTITPTPSSSNNASILSIAAATVSLLLAVL